MNSKMLGQLLRRALAEERKLDATRTIGTQAIDIDFYARNDSRPADDMKWAVTLCKWTGIDWKRIRRLAGPMYFDDALKQASRMAKQRGLNRI